MDHWEHNQQKHEHDFMHQDSHAIQAESVSPFAWKVGFLPGIMSY